MDKTATNGTGGLNPEQTRELQEFIGSPGLDVTTLEPKAIVHVMTEEVPYVIVVRDPTEAEVVVQAAAPRFEEPRLARLRGASSGDGSVFKSDWIVVGARLVLGVEGEFVYTPRVRYYEEQEKDPEEADRIIRIATKK